MPLDLNYTEHNSFVPFSDYRKCSVTHQPWTESKAAVRERAPLPFFCR